ncbi:uroporphyrinogen-III synthase-like [Penaeus indicus]|uniref:uroporphyrinogen-III synthase-like n=1 Tax=Penaeus indicus TaxID=29960 RepID=UPI00300C1AAA
MSTVWLLKSSDSDDDRYADALSKASFVAVHVPTLSFKFTNHGPLKNALQQPENHSGIIFTSKRAVEAVTEIYKNLSVDCHHSWSEKKIFVIGEATGRAVQQHLKLSHIGQESGNALQLAPIIMREIVAFDKPLLYPCGNLGRDELPKLLAQEDRDFRALTVYETQEHPQLKDAVSKHHSTGKMPSHLVFFSPSGVKFVLPKLKSVGMSLTGVKIIAIGPATNAALVQENIPVHAVCSIPSPEGLLHILKSPL